MTTFAETGSLEHVSVTVEADTATENEFATKLGLEPATKSARDTEATPSSEAANPAEATTTFADTGLPERALKAVAKLGFDAPTPVQEQAIPFVLEGRDVIAAASTGTGKTAAFLLPTMGTLPSVKRGPRAPRILVVSPTRELAQQIAHTAMKIGRETNHFTTTVFGGTSYGPQINELRRGTDVLIATPGRLNDLIDRGVVDLSAIEVLVLDEADRMLDMGFLPDVSKIVSKTPESRQTLLFSATIDESIQNNLGSLLHNPAVVEVARNGETAATVDQYLIPIKNFKKPELLLAVLEEKGHERVIVFTRTKNRAEECAEALKEAGYQVESIHSDKSQGNRRHALSNFRNGKAHILVATDVLARGIDVPQVDYVVNFDLPDMAEDYVHRIGRTGRAGETGLAISFVTRENKRILREIEKLIDKDLPYMTLESYETDPAVLGRGAKGASGEGGKRERSVNRNRKPSSGERKAKGAKGNAKTKDSKTTSGSKEPSTGYTTSKNGSKPNHPKTGSVNSKNAPQSTHSKLNKPAKSGKRTPNFNQDRISTTTFENERSTRGHKGDFLPKKGPKASQKSHNRSAGNQHAHSTHASQPGHGAKGSATSNKQLLRDAARKRQNAIAKASKNGSHGGYDYSKFAK